MAPFLVLRFDQLVSKNGKYEVRAYCVQDITTDHDEEALQEETDVKVEEHATTTATAAAATTTATAAAAAAAAAATAAAADDDDNGQADTRGKVSKVDIEQDGTFTP